MEQVDQKSLPSVLQLADLPPENLAANFFFRHFSPKEISFIIKSGTLLRCLRGEYLIREKEMSEDFFVVLSGKMVVTRSLYAGDEKDLGFIQPGDFFGEMAFLDGRPRSANVSCVEEGMVLRISAENFKRLSVKRPAIAYKMVRVIAITLVERLRTSNDIVEGFFSNPNKAILEFKTRLLKIQTMLQRL